MSLKRNKKKKGEEMNQRKNQKVGGKKYNKMITAAVSILYCRSHAHSVVCFEYVCA